MMQFRFDTKVFNLLSRNRSQSGFALGLILLVIVLMAAITTFISASGTRTDIGPELSRVEIMTFRNASTDLLRGIQRVATSCPKTSRVDFDACMNNIRTALTQTAPCENDPLPEIQRACPYHTLYGGASRIPLPTKMFTTANPRWDLALKVSPEVAANQLDAVLFINGLTQQACITLESTVLANLVRQAPLATQLRAIDNQFLPIARKEACIQYNGVAFNDQDIDREYSNPNLAFANFSQKAGIPVDTDVAPGITGYQYFLVIGNFYE